MDAHTSSVASRSELCDFLDLVDVQSEHQRSLHGHLADAFLALAREGYRDPSSALRTCLCNRSGHLLQYLVI